MSDYRNVGHGTECLKLINKILNNGYTDEIVAELEFYADTFPDTWGKVEWRAEKQFCETLRGKRNA